MGQGNDGQCWSPAATEQHIQHSSSRGLQLHAEIKLINTARSTNTHRGVLASHTHCSRFLDSCILDAGCSECRNKATQCRCQQAIPNVHPWRTAGNLLSYTMECLAVIGRKKHAGVLVCEGLEDCLSGRLQATQQRLQAASTCTKTWRTTWNRDTEAACALPVRLAVRGFDAATCSCLDFIACSSNGKQYTCSSPYLQGQADGWAWMARVGVSRIQLYPVPSLQGQLSFCLSGQPPNWGNPDVREGTEQAWYLGYMTLCKPQPDSTCLSPQYSGVEAERL